MGLSVVGIVVVIQFVVVAAAWLMLSEGLGAQGGGAGIPAARRSCNTDDMAFNAP